MRDSTSYLNFICKNRHFLAFGALLAGLSSVGQTFFLALFGGTWRETFELSHTAFGLLYSLATIASAAALISLGRQVDRVDLARFSSAVLVGAALGAFLLAASQSAWMLLIAFFLLRLCGQGLMIHTAQTAMAKRFELHRGRALGLAMLGLPVAEAIMPSIGVSLAANLGWRTTWVVLGIAVLLIVLPATRWMIRADRRYRQADEAPQQTLSARLPERSWTRAEVVRDGGFYRLLPAALGPGFLITALFFHQTTIADAQGWSLSWLASSFVAFAAGHVTGLLLGGSLVDRFGALRLIRVFLLPLIVGVALLAVGSHPWIAPAYLLLAGLSVGATGPVTGALWAELYGTRHLGAIRSLAHAAAILMTALAPVSAGLLLDTGISITALSLSFVGYGIGASLLAATVGLQRSSRDSS